MDSSTTKHLNDKRKSVSEDYTQAGGYTPWGCYVVSVPDGVVDKLTGDCAAANVNKIEV